MLPFFTWTPDSNHALFITVNRDHTELILNMWTPQSGELRALIKETAPDWINEDRYAAPIFLGDGVTTLGSSSGSPSATASCTSTFTRRTARWSGN